MAEFYKVLGENGEAINGGNGSWRLPHGKRPGKWMPPIEGDLEPCANGYHLCRKKDLVEWLGPTIWLAEAGGKVVRGGNKVVARRARLIKKFDTWNERTARLFACDCAERSLIIYEKQYPDDPRPREAVAVARRFAMGEATQEELDTAWAAAWDAAWITARITARVAAWDAAWITARDAARDAARITAWDAARDAAWATARDAAWATARAAEQKWQTKRLFDYLNGRVGAGAADGR